MVTTTPREFFHAELPFEVCVELLRSFGCLEDKSWLLLATHDPAAHLAAQLLSSRMPARINMLVGFTKVAEDDQSRQVVKLFLNDHVKPAIVEAEGFPSLQWAQCT